MQVCASVNVRVFVFVKVTQSACVSAIGHAAVHRCGGASDPRGSYANMSKALNEPGRHIALNMCRGDLKPWNWIFADAQSWRVTEAGEGHSGTWTQRSHGIKEGVATAKNEDPTHGDRKTIRLERPRHGANRHWTLQWF